MGFFDIFAPAWTRFGTPQGHVTETQRVAPGEVDIVPNFPTLRSAWLTLADGRTLSLEQQRRAYVGVVRFLAQYRAAAFARHLMALTVERRVRQNEYEAVDEIDPRDGGRFWVQLLQRPHPSIPPLEFYRWLSLARDLTDGAHFVVEHMAGPGGTPVPRYLHPVFAEYGRMEAALDASGNPTGWMLHRADGQRTEYRPEEVIRIAHAHPLYRMRGASLIEAAAYEIDADTANMVYSRDTARERGQPDVVLEAEGDVPTDAGNTMARLFGERYRAGARRGVPWTARGLKVKPLNLSARDMQFAERVAMNEDRLFTIFEVQPALFSDQAYASGQNGALRGFAVNTVQPNVDLIASTLEFELERAFLADPAVYRLRVPNVVPQDAEQMARVDEIHLRTGQRSPNELRRRDGLDDVVGGDEAFVSAGLQPLSIAGSGS